MDEFRKSENIPSLIAKGTIFLISLKLYAQAHYTPFPTPYALWAGKGGKAYNFKYNNVFSFFLNKGMHKPDGDRAIM